MLWLTYLHDVQWFEWQVAESNEQMSNCAFLNVNETEVVAMCKVPYSYKLLCHDQTFLQHAIYSRLFEKFNSKVDQLYVTSVPFKHTCKLINDQISFQIDVSNEAKN